MDPRITVSWCKKIFLYNNSNIKRKNYFNDIKLNDYKIKKLNKEEMA